jgi:hypothetical protein
MPVGWLTMGTPEDLRELIARDPDGFEAAVDRRVAEAGAVLIKIFWDQSEPSAYVVVGVPEHCEELVFAALERVFQTEVKRLWNLQELTRHRFDAS